MQDKRFCSQEYGPLPKFDTSKQRVAWFLMILEEKPVLCMLFVFAIFRSSIDVPFIFSEWSYGGMLDSLKVKLQKMIRLRLATLLNLIFRGKFNIARAQRRVDTEKYCTWVNSFPISPELMLTIAGRLGKIFKGSSILGKSGSLN